MSSSSPPPFEHDSFYKFVELEDPPAVAEVITEWCSTHNVLGTVLVATEGINAMLCGTPQDMASVRAKFATDARFADLFIKTTQCTEQVFSRRKVKVKPELVPLRIAGIDATRGGGRAVKPAEWRTLLDRDDVVILDNRNSFEYDVGHFRNALDPGIGDYVSFSSYFDAHLPEWEGKTIAMYCTGGIRCEKTAAWLETRGIEVLHLEGGIVNYFQTVETPTEEYEGDCFVFDTRRSISPTGNRSAQ
jgi:UPF0176 protein